MPAVSPPRATPIPSECKQLIQRLMGKDTVPWISVLGRCVSGRFGRYLPAPKDFPARARQECKSGWHRINRQCHGRSIRPRNWSAKGKSHRIPEYRVIKSIQNLRKQENRLLVSEVRPPTAASKTPKYLAIPQTRVLRPEHPESSQPAHD